MATLRAAVTAILEELSLAQNRANRLTRRLARKYRDDKILRIFPIPSQQLKEVEIDLHYGIDAVALMEGGGRDELAPSLGLFHQPCSWIATAVLDQVAARIRERERKEPEGRETLCVLRRRLEGAEIRDGLAQRLARQLLVRLGELVADEKLDREAAKRIIQRTLNDEVGQHPGLRDHIEPPTAEEADRRQLAIGDRLEQVLERACDEIDARLAPEKLQDQPNLEVFFDAERLAKLPAHAVQNLHIHATRFGTQWVVEEDGGEELVREV
ncbi:MAG: hypothetical protein GY719_28275 [bacterium]|nr:hypothetical protein [bacterium]